MKIYKYKDLSDLNKEKESHFYQIVLNNTIWCAKPDSLNDKDEFRSKFDCNQSSSTGRLLSQLIMETKYTNTNYPPPHLSTISLLNNKKLKEIVDPIIKGEIEKMRNTIGIACFSELKNDDNLWNIYGGRGNGVCIEIDIPDEFINKLYYRVNYVTEKIFHIDSFLESALDKSRAFDNYRNFLLTKTETWSKEKEIRFIGNRQEVKMKIDNGCYISEIIFGKHVPPDTLSQIESNIINHFNVNNIKITKLSCERISKPTSGLIILYSCVIITSLFIIILIFIIGRMSD